jgi:hypothetical protein
VNDPHVEYLTYRLETEESLEFEDPPPLEKESDDLRLRLAEDVLTVWPNDHFAREEEARENVEPYLRAWETFEALRRFGRREMRFVFESSRVVDRDPPPPGSSQVVQVKGIASVAAVGTVTAVSRERSYPEPPEGFVASPEVEFMLGRYDQYLRGREPLLAMAYACLTRLEHEARHARGGGTARRKAAREYGVDERVLSKLGHLTTVLGDEMGARKVEAQSENRPPNSREQSWIKGCVLTLIRRAGERSADPQRPLPRITMDDLPRL